MLWTHKLELGWTFWIFNWRQSRWICQPTKSDDSFLGCRGIYHIYYFWKARKMNGEYYTSLMDRLNDDLKKKRSHLTKKSCSSIYPLISLILLIRTQWLLPVSELEWVNRKRFSFNIVIIKQPPILRIFKNCIIWKGFKIFGNTEQSIWGPKETWWRNKPIYQPKILVSFEKSWNYQPTLVESLTEITSTE